MIYLSFVRFFLFFFMLFSVIINIIEIIVVIIVNIIIFISLIVGLILNVVLGKRNEFLKILFLYDLFIRWSLHEIFLIVDVSFLQEGSGRILSPISPFKSLLLQEIFIWFVIIIIIFCKNLLFPSFRSKYC